METNTWCFLPEVALANVFGRLCIVDKVSAIETCSPWKRASERREAWVDFNYSETAIWNALIGTDVPSTAQDFERHDKFHRILLQIVKDCCKHISIVCIQLQGISSFEVLDALFRYCCNVVHIKTTLRTDRIYEPEFQGRNCNEVASKTMNFFKRNSRMTHISLGDMNYDCRPNDPIPFGFSNATSVRSLWIVNSFRSCSLSNLMWMVNLRELAINPTHLNFSLLKHLTGCSLKHLYIVVSKTTQECNYEAINDDQWNAIRSNGQNLKVHCYFETRNLLSEKIKSFFKPSMPLTSLVYNRDLRIKDYDEMARILCQYSSTLEEFADFGRRFPARAQTPSFDNRFDTFVLHLVTKCPRLQTLLVLKEPISSSCLIFLAYKKLFFQNIVIREDMIEYVDDLPEYVVSDLEAREFIGQNFQNIDQLSAVISDLLGHAWRPLSREEFGQYVVEKYSFYSDE